ncbi:MAG TPA: type II secretion system F family protein [Candidatus Paceibacterota bacterium]|nr:type II secretion system F family protein [Candidatus Paceibacterota bacterium]
MLFNYTAVDQSGAQRSGTIDAINIDLAISALQRRGLIISSIDPVDAQKQSLANIRLFDTIKGSDVVMLSRQMTTLFEAQVSALRAFQLLAAEARTPRLAKVLTAIGDDIQGGSAISSALSRHPEVFSNFYVNMVRAGEEAGKLDETFLFLADYMDRNYEITSKAKNALIYPAFIIGTFVIVIVLMMTMVIPRLAVMLEEVGQDIPVYTKVVIGISNLFSDYALLWLGFLVVGGFFLVRYVRTESGYAMFSRARMSVPVIGSIYQKLYLSRIADTLGTMLKSGIQMLRGLEVTGTVVEDPTYERILSETAADVKAGLPVSEAMRKHPEIPGIVVAMIKIGEETGNMGNILDAMARFYRREVNNAVDTLVSLIEPIMIVALAVGVAILLASVLLPIYNIAAGI